MIDIGKIVRWKADTMLEVLPPTNLPDGEIPGRLVGVPSVPIPEPVKELRWTTWDDISCQSLCETAESLMARTSARLHNEVAAVLRVTATGVYYIPVTDGEGEAFWFALNATSETHFRANADGTNRQFAGVTRADAERQIAYLREKRGMDVVYAGFKPAEITPFDWLI